MNCLPQRMRLDNLLVQHTERDMHSGQERSRVNRSSDAFAAHQEQYRHELYRTEAGR
jgi:hypothetical protein